MIALDIVRRALVAGTIFPAVRQLKTSSGARLMCNTLRQRELFAEIPFSKAILAKANNLQSKKYQALVDEFNELREISNDSDDTLRSLLEQDYEKLSVKFNELQKEIIDSITQDEYTYLDRCCLDVTPGVGGQEAMLFAADLFQIYLRYVKWRNWHIISVSDDFNDLGGLKNASLEIKGSQCFRYLRHEAGVHRVQRVPKTEKTGRVHTSTVAIAIQPLISDGGDVKIENNDIKIEFTTSSGPGGQHVNKKETCCRILHLPTNIQVTCQETRSAEKNEVKALTKLKQLLARRQDEKNYCEYKRLKKSQCGDLGRSEKIRTYNLPQDRLTDHRLSESFYNLRTYITGDPAMLDEIIQKLENQEREAKLNHMLAM